MNEQSFLDDIMLDALEDYIRLWDISSLAAAAFPDSSRTTRHDIAERVVGTVLDRGWVDVFRRDWTGSRPGPETPVDLVEARAALDRTENWDDQSSGPEYVLLRSEKGAKEFAEDARRRGLLRP